MTRRGQHKQSRLTISALQPREGVTLPEGTLYRSSLLKYKVRTATYSLTESLEQLSSCSTTNTCVWLQVKQLRDELIRRDEDWRGTKEFLADRLFRILQEEAQQATAAKKDAAALPLPISRKRQTAADRSQRKADSASGLQLRRTTQANESANQTSPMSAAAVHPDDSSLHSRALSPSAQAAFAVRKTLVSRIALAAKASAQQKLQQEQQVSLGTPPAEALSSSAAAMNRSPAQAAALSAESQVAQSAEALETAAYSSHRDLPEQGLSHAQQAHQAQQAQQAQHAQPAKPEHVSQAATSLPRSASNLHSPGAEAQPSQAPGQQPQPLLQTHTRGHQPRQHQLPQQSAADTDLHSLIEAEEEDWWEDRLPDGATVATSPQKRPSPSDIQPSTSYSRAPKQSRLQAHFSSKAQSAVGTSHGPLADRVGQPQAGVSHTSSAPDSRQTPEHSLHPSSLADGLEQAHRSNGNGASTSDSRTADALAESRQSSGRQASTSYDMSTAWRHGDDMEVLQSNATGLQISFLGTGARHDNKTR